jgi:acid phosphatase family membrane protein YuiD
VGRCATRHRRPGRCAARRRPPLLGSRPMVLAMSKAVSMDIGLGATFLGIGVIVNIIIVYIAVQIRGERQQNQEYREQMLDS